VVIRLPFAIRTKTRFCVRSLITGLRLSISGPASAAAASRHTSRLAMEVQRRAEIVLRKVSADESGAKTTRDKSGRPNRGSASGRQLKTLEQLRCSGLPGGMQDFRANKSPIFPVRLRQSQ